MSDPVSRSEMEDVLASVRRLVTSDGTEQKDAEPKRAPAQGRLVLTSDLRIADPAQEAKAAAEEAPSAPAAPPKTTAPEGRSPYTESDAFVFRRSATRPTRPSASSSSRYMTLEERIAELEAAVTSSSFDFEPDGSEDTTQHRPDSVPHRSRPAAAPQEVERDTAPERPEMAEDQTDAPERRERGDVPTPPLRLRPEDAAHGPVEDSAAADEVDQDADETLRAVLRHTVGDARDDAAETAVRDAVAKPERDEPSVQEPEGDARAQDEGDDLFAPDARGQAEPAPASGEDELLRRLHLSMSQEDERAEKAAEPRAATPALAAGPAGIDEDVLRDMVAEIVREELQGALGERITRNVRKLVRREIMRAASIREFE